MTAIDSTAAIGRRGIPAILVFAGEFLNRSGRRIGNTMAATLTHNIVITPANTPIESSVAKELESTDHARMPVTIIDATMIAGIGAWVRSLTSESLLGRIRSKDQAKMVRTGINVFGNMAGRFQKRKLTAMSKAKIELLAAMLAIRL